MVFYLLLPLPALMLVLYVDQSLMWSHPNLIGWMVIATGVTFCLGLARIVRWVLHALNATFPCMFVAAVGFAFLASSRKLHVFSGIWFGALAMMIVFAGGLMDLALQLFKPSRPSLPPPPQGTALSVASRIWPAAAAIAGGTALAAVMEEGGDTELSPPIAGDDNHRIDSYITSPIVNIDGTPMIGDTGVDVRGNAFGTTDHHDDWSSSGGSGMSHSDIGFSSGSSLNTDSFGSGSGIGIDNGW